MTTILSAAEAAPLGLSKPKRKSKYGNKRTVLDGIAFHSKAEATYYSQLKLREKAGEVGGVDMQRSFALLAPNGMLITTYRADFCFIDHAQDGRFRCIDVKGVETKEFKIKKKLMKALLGIDVEVVRA